MVVPSDEDYQQTKQLKITGAPLPSPFRELAAWIDATYGVHVLNILHDIIIPHHQPRLRIILETIDHALKFRDAPYGNYLPTAQNDVRQQFEALLAQHPGHRFALENLFVIFENFESVARVEANARITDEDIRRLKTKLANPDLWEISRCFDGVTFMFYTDAQLQRHRVPSVIDVYAQEYARVVEPYDEFGYLKENGLFIHFDSKENFDTNYQSNWYYYYK
jgi:hypothetical protein